MVQKLDPRIHFTLVCAARFCPPISFFDAERLEEQISQSASNFINSGGAEYDDRENTLWLSRIFKWYQADFGGLKGVKEILLHYSSDETLLKAINTNHLKVKYQPYDWSINQLVQ